MSCVPLWTSVCKLARGKTRHCLDFEPKCNTKVRLVSKIIPSWKWLIFLKKYLLEILKIAIPSFWLDFKFPSGHAPRSPERLSPSAIGDRVSSSPKVWVRLYLFSSSVSWKKYCYCCLLYSGITTSATLHFLNITVQDDDDKGKYKCVGLSATGGSSDSQRFTVRVTAST